MTFDMNGYETNQLLRCFLSWVKEADYIRFLVLKQALEVAYWVR